ncbi:Proteasome protease subunit, partial [Giardia duodenalis]
VHGSLEYLFRKAMVAHCALSALPIRYQQEVPEVYFDLYQSRKRFSSPD